MKQSLLYLKKVFPVLNMKGMGQKLEDIHNQQLCQ